MDDKETPGPREEPGATMGSQDCEMSLALSAAPCPCLSGDPTAHLLNAVSKPNPNMQTQLQEGGAGAFTVSHQRKVWVYSAMERPQVP